MFLNFFYWVVHFLGVISWVWADIMVAPPLNQSLPAADEKYNVSRFGSAPSQSGASLEFSQETGVVKSTPVIQTDGNSLTTAELNPTPSAGSRNGVQEVALIVGDLGFFPKTVLVTKNIPVKLFVTGASKKTLCLMIDPFQVRKQIRSQKIEEINFIPTVSGKIRIYCPVDGMEGALFVKESSEEKKKGVEESGSF